MYLNFHTVRIQCNIKLTKAYLKISYFIPILDFYFNLLFLRNIKTIQFVTKENYKGLTLFKRLQRTKFVKVNLNLFSIQYKFILIFKLLIYLYNPTLFKE